ncbi:Uncharacterized protein HZ326_2605 [Fusarium oxysporum f. sp. albedinis]|nr:Uncharacterized protein HZ326_2605 [Fusarium oxysporum f. sp. albedinis]
MHVLVRLDVRKTPKDIDSIKQFGAVEARRAHNPEVARSKRAIAKFPFFAFFEFESSIGVFPFIDLFVHLLAKCHDRRELLTLVLTTFLRSRNRSIISVCHVSSKSWRDTKNSHIWKR